ncbi:MAG: conjugative transfer protein MobI(A/C) [Azonexus sp.]
MAVRSLLESRLERVFEEAIDLGNSYLQAVDVEHQGVERNRKHTLQFRVGRSGHPIALEWYRTNWQGANGQEQRLPRIFRWRGKADARVVTVKPDADECRRQAACLGDMLVTLGRLERFVQVHPLCPRGQEKPAPFGITVLSGSTVQRTGCET